MSHEASPPYLIKASGGHRILEREDVQWTGKRPASPLHSGQGQCLQQTRWVRQVPPERKGRAACVAQLALPGVPTGLGSLLGATGRSWESHRWGSLLGWRLKVELILWGETPLTLTQTSHPRWAIFLILTGFHLFIWKWRLSSLCRFRNGRSAM